MKASAFVFESATFHAAARRVDFTYAITFKGSREPLHFTESLTLPTARPNAVPEELFTELLKNLHLVLGVSYYKLYCPRQIKMPYALTPQEANFWKTLYEKGLGEFFYRNKIDFRGLVRFPATKTAAPFLPGFLPTKERALLGIGGGKDSIVAGELLKERKLPVTAFVLETEKDSPVVNNVIKAMGLKKLVVRRHLDPQLFNPPADATNGHVPISAVFAFVGTFVAALYGYRYVVVANEFSSNFGNVNYLGSAINHQWSKSAEFEALFQEHVRTRLTRSITYFSAIRHFYEIRTVEAFTRYPKYFPIFTSCNRAFRVHRDRPDELWCGECPKCTFVFAQLAAFLPPEKLLPIFKKNLFEDKALAPLFKDLCGLGALKPFDCVGTFEEMRAALRRAAKTWPNVPKVAATRASAAELFKIQDAPTLPAHFKFLGLKNVLLLGYGKEGKVTQRYLKKFYPRLPVLVADQAKNPAYLDSQDSAEFAVKTPGLPKKNLRIPYTTATNIFFAQNTAFTFGVTGSKGKSTTASLLAHLLQAQNPHVKLLGNIGAPMLEVLLKPTHAKAAYVLELSSYQLDDCTHSPDVAVVTNLFPEHMNYHGGVDAYYEAKKNIFTHQTPAQIFIYNPKHPLLKKWAKEAHGQTRPFSEWTPEKTPLLGEHNRSNLAAAIAAAQEFQLSKNTITAALASFKPLAHRLQNVGTFRGITFYDDAISTSPESTIEALKALAPLGPVGTIFLGGEDRGYDFTELEKALRKHKVKNLVLFPATGDRMLRSTRGFTILKTRSMKAAVAFAYKHTPTGAICLLSMASPSYSLWKNFEEKGDDFASEARRQA